MYIEREKERVHETSVSVVSTNGSDVLFKAVHPKCRQDLSLAGSSCQNPGLKAQTPRLSAMFLPSCWNHENRFVCKSFNQPMALHWKGEGKAETDIATNKPQTHSCACVQFGQTTGRIPLVEATTTEQFSHTEVNDSLQHMLACTDSALWGF